MPMRLPVFCLFLLLSGTTVLAQSTVPAKPETSPDKKPDAAAAEPAEDKKPQYIRIRRNDRGSAVALETSIIRFANSKRYPNKTVDLLGAIHLGEGDYYEQLNRQFKIYDALLFEAVMPESAVRQGLRPGGGGHGRRVNLEEEWSEFKVGLNAVGLLQVGMKDVLGLEFQLSAIDYSPRNFVHADMTQEAFERAMARRGESFSEMLAREMAKAALSQQQTNPVAQSLDLLLSVMASDRSLRMRRIAAVEMAKASDKDPFAGPDGTSAIITERNLAALNVLKRQLQRGRKQIGIFYGAGHFRHMEQQLIEEFGFERTGERWLTAWKLKQEEPAE